MRVTTMLSDVQYRMQLSQQALATATEQLSTGLRVNRLSDDPSASADYVRSLEESANVDQYTSNTTALQSKMQTADSAISAIVTSLTNAISIGTAGANGISSAAERQIDATQIASLLSSVVAQANTTYQGSYVFGGSETKFPPVASAAATFVSSGSVSPSSASMLTAGSVFTVHDAVTGKTMTFSAVAGDTVQTLQDAIANAASSGVLSSGTGASINSAGQFQVATNDSSAGIVVNTNDPVFGSMHTLSGTEVPNTYVYVGNDAVNRVQVGDSLSVNANLPGSQFLSPSSGVLSALSSLFTALQSGTSSDIGDAVSGVKDALDNLDVVRVPVGDTLRALSSQQSILGQEEVSLTSQQSSLVGISTAEAATNFSNAQLANQSVLAAAAKALPMTLLDYLR